MVWPGWAVKTCDYSEVTLAETTPEFALGRQLG